MRRRRKREGVNPFVSLTDVLFNVLLVFIFASAIFAQDISRKFAENQAFQERLANLQLERDDLIRNVENLTTSLDAAQETQDKLQETNLSLEEQIGILVSNLDSAQNRQEQLTQQIALLIGDLGDATTDKRILEEKITVILGDLDIAQDANKLLEDKVALVLGDLDEAEQLTAALRNQVSALSRNNFLVVELEWLSESPDLDLHVIDPDGNRFYWNQASVEGSSGRLTLDNRIGARPNKPGLEIWTDRELKLGTYRVEVGLWGCGRLSEEDGYKPCQEDAVASVLVRHRDDDVEIDDVRIPLTQSYAPARGQDISTTLNNLVLVAEIDVTENAEGEVQVNVRPASGL
jgi:cell division protein FtsB